MTRQALTISGASHGPTGESSHADWRLWRRVVESGFTARKQAGRLDYRVHGESMLAKAKREGVGYFERAALDRETVTIFTPLAGRASVWPAYSAWLESQTWPREQCRLVLCDTSGDDDFHGVIRDWALSSSYPDVRIYRQTVGAKGLAEAPRGSPSALEAVNDACRRIYNRMALELTTPFVLVLEDDVIPPPDAIDRLMRCVSGDVAAVSGLYRARPRSGTGFVAWLTDPVRLDQVPGVGADRSPIDVGGTGFWCLLLRRDSLRGETFARLPGDSVYYDVAFATRVKAKGDRWVLDRGCPAEHLELPGPGLSG